jgi:outer membrane receptor protein involved in Fe transport
MRYFFTFSLLLLLPFSALFAQNGVLKGRVTNQETGEPLPGATVFIVGTYKGAYSDDEGRFQITGIKAGDYSIRFSYIGFNERVYNGVSIPDGGSRTLDVAMTEVGTTLGEVEIIGKKNLIDLESGQSATEVGAKELKEMRVTNVKDVVAMQVGVSENPDGIQIRGGRVYETEYLIDGINAQDPLAGTGFGVDVNTSALQAVKVVTGGSTAEYGGGTAGVIAANIKEGSEQLEFSANYRRDNLGFNTNQGPSWNTDEANVSISGPIPFTGGKLTFFLNGSMFLSDNYFGPTAQQLHSSLLPSNDSLWAPRQDNRWAKTLKLAWDIKPGMRLTLTNQHSLNINQSTRSLQIIGNDEVVRPGFQFPFSLNLDNANTYTHRSNLSVLNLKGVLGERWSYSASVGRLFTNLRADANGRPFRTETVDQIFDPASIVTNPIDIFNPNDPAVYVFPGPGLVNNGGIATLWHDHYVEEYTLKSKFTFKSKSKVHYLGMGFEHKEQTFQWIDVTRPWVGAPIQINDSVTTPSTSVGESSDVWRASPTQGGIFVQDEIRYKGIIATLGLRLNYWAPSKFVDNAVEDPNAPVLDAIREDYREQTFGLMGKRWKARLLPRINVSFPVTDNNVLYFNYGHSMRLAHPRFIYAGLDPVFQDRSFLASLGNPNINPEVTVGYEVGLKSQITKDLALTATAFYNDKFDYIVRRSIIVKDQTGRFVNKIFSINQDYARIRGLEVAFTRRIGNSFTGTISGAYQIATGKSNSAAESELQILNQGFVSTTKEQFLAWDRPFDLKLLLIFTPDSTVYLGGIPLEGFRVTLSSTLKSGLRYTPHTREGINEFSGRPEFLPILDQPFAEVSAPWFWTNLSIRRDFFFGRDRDKIFTLSFEVDNLTNYLSAALVNPVTGRAYQPGDDVPVGWRDARFPDPQDRGTPPDNPARFTEPRHIWFGASMQF